MTKKRKPVANLFFYIGLAIVMFIILFPMIWLVLCTFKPNEEIFSSELHILPINPTIDSYIYAFNDQNKLLLYLGNSLFTAALTAPCFSRLQAATPLAEKIIGASTRLSYS